MSQKNLICEDCGTENPSTHKFCSECGNYLLDDQTNDLPKDVANAVQKLETRLKTNYQSPFWPDKVARPIFKVSIYYLAIAFLYLFLENIGAGFFGINLSIIYTLLRTAELSLPLYLAAHLKNNPKKILIAASLLIWVLFLITDLSQLKNLVD